MRGKLTGPLLAVCALWHSAGGAWDFSEKLAVTEAAGPGIFHHVDSAGRRNVAVSDGYVAVAWEDNRSRRPAVYVAFKALRGDGFTREYRLSDAGTEAYEPAVGALPGNRFIVVFEQAGYVHAVLAKPQGAGPPQRLSEARGAQATVATRAPDAAVVAWSEAHPTRSSRIQTTTVTVSSDASHVVAGPLRPVERRPPAAPQLYPALAWADASLVVAWEDRRAGHTRIVASVRRDDAFTRPAPINEFLTNRNEYDKGSGATRVVLAGGEHEVLAVWMDKREGGKGYSPYAAWSEHGARGFGRNQAIHDDFGDTAAQWNPTVSSNRAGATVVAWEDARIDDTDVWLAWPGAGGWSENFQVPPASGEGQQGNASLQLDEQGGLHLVWIERAGPGAPTRLWYSYGQQRDS